MMRIGRCDVRAIVRQPWFADDRDALARALEALVTLLVVPRLAAETGADGPGAVVLPEVRVRLRVPVTALAALASPGVAADLGADPEGPGPSETSERVRGEHPSPDPPAMSAARFTLHHAVGRAVHDAVLAAGATWAPGAPRPDPVPDPGLHPPGQDGVRAACVSRTLLHAHRSGRLDRLLAAAAPQLLTAWSRLLGGPDPAGTPSSEDPQDVVTARLVAAVATAARLDLPVSDPSVWDFPSPATPAEPHPFALPPDNAGTVSAAIGTAAAGTATTSADPAAAITLVDQAGETAGISTTSFPAASGTVPTTTDGVEDASGESPTGPPAEGSTHSTVLPSSRHFGIVGDEPAGDSSVLGGSPAGAPGGWAAGAPTGPLGGWPGGRSVVPDIARSAPPSSRHGTRPAPQREVEVPTVLPFLLLGPLQRMGVLDAVAAHLAGPGGEQDLAAFAAALARKTLPPPARGWLHEPAALDTIAVFAGDPHGFAGDPAGEASPERLADAEAVWWPPAQRLIVDELVAERPAAWPLLVVPGDTGYAVADSTGVFPMTLDAAPDEVDRLWRSFGRPPMPDEIPACAPLAELVAASAERPASGRQGYAAALDGPIATLAGAALAALAWQLWHGRESTHPMLALDRFADLDGLVRSGPYGLTVRVPLGRRHADLRDRGALRTVDDVPWLGGRPVDFTGG
ncbi:hypothetical protein [Actinoplanes sp. NPDC023714]|uniref:hypothetical protein n=1 Tax=Actinoplanes sp. NPDC023714 TaxID=3154322 RepID=UPI0033F8947C